MPQKEIEDTYGISQEMFEDFSKDDHIKLLMQSLSVEVRIGQIYIEKVERLSFQFKSIADGDLCGWQQLAEDYRIDADPDIQHSCTRNVSHKVGDNIVQFEKALSMDG